MRQSEAEVYAPPTSGVHRHARLGSPDQTQQRVPFRVPAFRLLRSSRLIAVLPALVLLAGCSTLPAPRADVPCSGTTPPEIAISADGKTATTQLSVLTYNIEGLSWPARKGRGPDLREIGTRLRELRATGRAPDVVLFQEMFGDAAKRAVASSGYPAIHSGPRRTTASTTTGLKRLPGRSHIKHGEIGMHVFGSGLAIASRYSIIDHDRASYGLRSCAGFDCLANKGIMLARIEIPGVPSPVDIYDTHMNSQGASRAPTRRNLPAHDRQAREASRFINHTHDDAIPLVFGGDFNMRRSEPRWDNFSKYQSLELVHRLCRDPNSGCEVRVSWHGDTPWMNTQDLQFLWNGDAVKIRPIRVESMFDGQDGGPVLSDHHGFLVTYELSWDAALTRRPACGALAMR